MTGFVATLCAIVGLAVAAPGPGHLQWSDCSTDPSNTALTVNSMDIHPIPLPLPGDIHFSLNLTVNRRIEHLFIDTELYQQGVFEVKLPCIGDTNIGSCQNIDSCSVLDRVLNGSSSVVSQSLSQQIDSMLLTALGHRAHCPIDPETVVVHNEKITLSALPSALSMIANGSYRVRIMVKDDPTTTANVGCLEFVAGITTAPVVG